MMRMLLEMRGVQGVFAVGLDGFLLGALRGPTADPDMVAALSAIADGLALRIGEHLAMGGLRWTLLEFRRAKLMIARVGERLLVVLADKAAVLGRLIDEVQARGGEEPQLHPAGGEVARAEG